MTSLINASTSTGVVVTPDTSGSLGLQTAGTTAVTIDSSQNVGIGTTSPTSKLHVYGATNSQLTLQNATNSSYVGNISGSMEIQSADIIKLLTSGANERMRINTGGNVGIGDTNPSYRLSIASSASIPGLKIRCGGNGGVPIIDGADTNGNSAFSFDAIGSLYLSSSYAQKASGTTWANPSDVRLKDNIADYTKGLAELQKISVKTWEYNGKANTTVGTKGLGVIADEIIQVLPETVDTYKAKLNVDDETETDIKRFDATEITWLLVNAVKELKAELDATKAEVAALKGAA